MRVVTDLVCWKCGVSLTPLPLPLSRLAECPGCSAYLHCCRQCRSYNARLTVPCDEERAEEVRDKEGANFCDWFQPRPDAYHARDEGDARSARARLDELFGAPASGRAPDAARDPLHELFAPDQAPED